MTSRDQPSATNGCNGLAKSTDLANTQYLTNDHESLPVETGNSETSVLVDNSLTERRTKLSLVLSGLTICPLLYNLLISGVFATSSGVIYVEIIELFGITRTQASLLPTIYLPIATCTSIFNVHIMRKFGLGPCLIVGSILTSVGFMGTALATNATQVIGILGVVTVGGPLISFLIESYGFSLAMVTFAGIAAFSFVGNSFLWFRLHRSNTEQQIASSSRTSIALLGSVFRNKIYLAFFCVDVIRIAFFMFYGNFLVDNAYTLGFSLETSAFFASLHGLGSLCGRTVNGIVFSVKRWRGTNQYGITVAILGIAIAVMAFMSDYYELLTMSFIIGLLSGTLSAFQYLLPYEIVETEEYGTAIGIAATLYGATTVITAPIAGWVRDTTNSYDALYILALPLCGVSGLSLLVYQLYKDYCGKHSQKDMVTERKKASQIPLAISDSSLESSSSSTSTEIRLWH